jgi:hypothetical protein
MHPRAVASLALLAEVSLAVLAVWSTSPARAEQQVKLERVQTQFIAALGDPAASSGDGAQGWGIWRVDPGPRGVRLGSYPKLEAAGGVAPAEWTFDRDDWWLEEHGLIMEKPEFPLAPGKYLVTGDRDVTTLLTVHPMDGAGNQRWELDGGATLYDVTHLPCRSARYTPATSGGTCSPAGARQEEFSVTPGAPMPPVEGCSKQDYAVLFVIAVGVED